MTSIFIGLYRFCVPACLIFTKKMTWWDGTRLVHFSEIKIRHANTDSVNAIKVDDINGFLTGYSFFTESFFSLKKKYLLVNA